MTGRERAKFKDTCEEINRVDKNNTTPRRTMLAGKVGG